MEVGIPSTLVGIPSTLLVIAAGEGCNGETMGPVGS
jgi:hypothetical protein